MIAAIGDGHSMLCPYRRYRIQACLNFIAEAVHTCEEALVGFFEMGFLVGG